ncbi:MAG: hypothetical protein F6K26_52970, partial [Moorea sp. SIO2I5]|nr:hypothetical protein [Moorena sp. SIO2I5]
SDHNQTKLIRTCWRGANKLDLANLGNTYLKNNKLRKLLIEGEGEKQNFDREDLRFVYLSEANLESASFIDADLSQSNLEGANLKKANLVQTNLDLANLSNAYLTGANIKDWGITRRTILDGIECKFFYIKNPEDDDYHSYRIPPEKTQESQENEGDQEARKDKRKEDEFEKDEFQIFITSLFDTLDLYHKDNNLKPGLAIAILKGLTEDYPVQFELVGLEKRGDNQFIIKLKVFGETSHYKLRREYYNRYDQTLPLYDPKKLLPSTDTEDSLEKEIQTVNENPSTETINLHISSFVIVEGGIKKMEQRNIKADSYSEQRNTGIDNMIGGEIREGTKVAGIINEVQQQDLVQAAA